MSIAHTPFARFLFWGSVHTVATYVLYLGMLSFSNYQLAYTVTFVVGVVMSYALNTRMVFRKRWSWRKLIQFPMVYVVQYFLGMGLMWLLVARLDFDERLAPIPVVAILVPVTYLMAKAVIEAERGQ
jgi:putative flippase GtrA